MANWNRSRAIAYRAEQVEGDGITDYRRVQPIHFTRAHYSAQDADPMEDEGIKLSLARRRCHDVGHRQCRGHRYVVEENGESRVVFTKCRPDNCRSCKDEQSEAWNRSKHTLKSQADMLLWKGEKTQGKRAWKHSEEATERAEMLKLVRIIRLMRLMSAE